MLTISLKTEDVTSKKSLTTNFIKKNNGEQCLPSNRIKAVVTCKEAASALNLEFMKTWNNSDQSPGCLFARYGVYFNMALNAKGQNDDHAEICIGEILHASRLLVCFFNFFNVIFWVSPKYIFWLILLVGARNYHDSETNFNFLF